jgi:hypothetical protein
MVAPLSLLITVCRHTVSLKRLRVGVQYAREHGVEGWVLSDKTAFQLRQQPALLA